MLLSLTSPAGTGVLVPTRLAATEAIIAPFRFDIDARAAASIDPLSMLNQPACLAAGALQQDFRLSETAPPRVSTAQYNETALHFGTRLMEEGWYYFFTHAADKHTLVVTDSNAGFGAPDFAALRLVPDTTADRLISVQPADLLAGRSVQPGEAHDGVRFACNLCPSQAAGDDKPCWP